MIYADVCRGLNHIGFLGENEHRTFRFRESAEILAMYPDATVVVMNRRPGDPAAYPVAPGYVTIEGGMVCWTVQSGDLAKVGRGKVSVSFFQGDVIAKMIKYDTMIDDALDGSGTPPDPWLAWIMEVVAAGEHAPTIIDGVWWAWSVAEEKYIDTQTPATGPAGNGIQSVQLNQDYTLTITFTNGSSYTTTSIRGEPGADYEISQADYAAIAAIVAQDAQFQEKVDAARGYANTARNYADGKNLDGSTSSQHSENNAYYWNQQAQSAKTDAVGAKNAIEGMTVSATELQPGATPTITKTVDPQTGAVNLNYGIPPGADGQNGEGVPTGGTTGQVLKKKSGTDYDTEWGNEPTVPVTDVQVNGTSVLNQGVANVPKANNDSLGVVAPYASNGIGIVNNTGRLFISKANNSSIKVGTNDYTPIVPSNQHNATFYGLAKAAGDSTQSASSNAVGTYTEAAKSAISDMLNAPISVSGTTPSITALSGVRYVCGECATLDIVVPASGCIDVTFESGSTATVLTITPPSGQMVSWANGFDPTLLDANTTYELNICDLRGVAGSWT